MKYLSKACFAPLAMSVAFSLCLSVTVDLPTRGEGHIEGAEGHRRVRLTHSGSNRHVRQRQSEKVAVLQPEARIPVQEAALPAPDEDAAPSAVKAQAESTEDPPEASADKENSLKLSVSNQSPRQGETIKVSLSGPADAFKQSESGTPEPTIQFDNASIKLFPIGDTQSSGELNFSTLVAIPAIIKPGSHTLTADGAQCAVNVRNAGFPVQRLRLPKEKDNFNASPGEKEAIKKAKETLTDTRMWSGTFQVPVKKARKSTRFGLRRIVNGKLLDDYFHSGLDFAAPRGTPITSVADGKVILTGKNWKLHGNAVCIDHGQGVISIYIHMTSIAVEEGQTIKAGERVGTVGSTGRASGPHLHFGLYVNNVAADPEFWFAKTY
ncbi:MAG: M23 family metallopeptidase [Cyanobacteria bacterium]|nr:M23 family metallopeptidase [Cyanobacteriota bacterium]